MVRFLTEELDKDYFVKQYIQSFKRILLVGDANKLSAREESLLELEKKSSELFFDSFLKQHGRAPDEDSLLEQVKVNFLKRSHFFKRSAQVIDEEHFILSHVDQVKRMKEMKREIFVEGGYSYILEREKKLARDYFRKNDDYPEGYEELIISRSITAVNCGLEKLANNFIESFNFFYRGYIRGNSMHEL
ncbi:hypothetical protein BCR24_06590 [Enterococcus ureilyticus]|uniref:Uncharacterized protein n=2 Tax=Enterococcus ureilyticus TaxID=1131292 RepID=A0A1E5H9R3_9ENTE|nr:hypothetical protein [Enterococcus ureilyticus]MBM7688436.1 hypothetical protein [Enterococcus ureilyticus]OEG21683.1 hypothetical protein BCR24_06590 [Enterococcus ureilyticus]